MPGPHSHADKYSSEPERSAIHGFSQREKLSDDFRLTRQSEIQIRKQAFLVQGLLCGHSRAKQDCNSRVYQKPTSRGYHGRPDIYQGVC